MALFLNNKDNRTELQNRLASELNERMKQKKALEYEKPEPAILENQHTTKLGGLIAIITISVIAIGLIIYLVST